MTDAVQEQQEHVGSAERLRASLARRGDLLAALALVLLALVAVLPQVLRQAPLSVLDEPSHLDYSWRIAHGQVPAAGDPIAPEVVAMWNCYGNEMLQLPACGTSGPVEAYPAQAEQYNFGHPPLYYAATGLAARAIDAATPLDFVTAARGLGALWLAAGMVVLHLALRRLAVPLVLAAATAAASGMWWSSLSSATIVTNDAPFLLTSAAALLLLGRIVQGRVGVVVPVVVAALGASVKVMNGLPFLAVAGALVVSALLPAERRPWASRRRLIGLAAAMVAAVGAVYVAWTRFQGGRGDPAWQNPVEGVNSTELSGSPFSEWSTTLLRGFAELGHSYVSPGAAVSEPVVVMTQLVSIVGIAAIFVGIAVGRAGSALALLALATLIGAGSWPLVVQLQAYLSSGGTHYFMQPSHRYGVTMGPMALALVALAAERLGWSRAAAVGMAAVALVTVAAVLLARVLAA